MSAAAAPPFAPWQQRAYDHALTDVGGRVFAALTIDNAHHWAGDPP